MNLNNNKKSPIEGALSYFLPSQGIYKPPVMASTIINGPSKTKHHPRTCLPGSPLGDFVFWHVPILPPNSVPQLELVNNSTTVAIDKTAFFMGFLFFTHALMSGYLFMQRRTYSLTSCLRYSYDLSKKIKHAYAVGCNTLVALWRLRVSRHKAIAERYNCNTKIVNNCNTNNL